MIQFLFVNIFNEQGTSIFLRCRWSGRCLVLVWGISSLSNKYLERNWGLRVSHVYLWSPSNGQESPSLECALIWCLKSVMNFFILNIIIIKQISRILVLLKRIILILAKVHIKRKYLNKCFQKCARQGIFYL